MRESNKKFGKMIRENRKLFKMSLEKYSELCHVSTSLVGNIENGCVASAIRNFKKIMDGIKANERIYNAFKSELISDCDIEIAALRKMPYFDISMHKLLQLREQLMAYSYEDHRERAVKC